MADLHFNVYMDGKITFEIHHEQGVLPEVSPEPRAKMTRTEKAAAKVAAKAAAEQEAATEEKAPTAMPEVPSAITESKAY